MAEHKYAQVLRWIADGKAVQCKAHRGEWVELEEAGRALHSIGLGTSIPPEGYRLKPRTVKIGSREVEAPVLEPEVGQTLWYWDNYHEGPRDGKPSKEKASNGEWFASSDAARAAYAAYTALLRGEA